MREHDPGRARGILSIWNDISPEIEDFYERWYMSEHFPERLGVPGFLRGRRYEAIDADRRYFTFYELVHADVLFSGAYLARLNAPTAWTETVMRSWGPMFRTVCERTRRKGEAVGGYAAVARIEAAAELPVDLADRLMAELADPGVVAVDCWKATPRQNDMTTEASRRPSQDRFVSGAVVVEATRRQSMEKAAAALPGLLPRGAAPQIGTYRLIALQETPF